MVPTLAGGFNGNSVGYAVVGLPQLLFLELFHFKLNTSVITASDMAAQHSHQRWGISFLVTVMENSGLLHFQKLELKQGH